jgi:hypothetical protein
MRIKTWLGPRVSLLITIGVLALATAGRIRWVSAGTRGGGGPAPCVTNPIVTTNADSGAGSLRDAIANACDGSTITFSGLVSSPITLTTGELAIDKNLTIQGPGANLLSVSGGNTALHVFKIGSVTPAVNVTLSGMTISGGNANGGGNDDDGGGVLYDGAGAVTVTSSTISGNTAGHGGGISVEGGTAAITNSTISGNTATSIAGGILNMQSTVTITNSTISGNTATISGGGVLVEGGTATITNSTISGNSSSSFGSPSFGAGGGILNVDNGSVTITNCTISGNMALGTGVNCLGCGGGGLSTFGTTTVLNTVIAGNSTTTAGPDVGVFGNGVLISQGHNLIGKSDGSSGFTNGVNGDQLGSIAMPLDPKLELDQMGNPFLKANGGPTKTIALLSGSPAIDAGDDTVFGPPLSLMSDQRGPDFTRKAGSHVDIGAFEFGAICPTIDATVSGTVVVCAGGGSSNITVTISGGTAPYTVTLTDGGGTMTGSSPLTFTVNPVATTSYSVASGMDSDECPVTGAGSATVTDGSAPVVTINPVNQTITGDSVTFTAAASGTPAPTVQWQVSVGGGPFTNINAATGATLTFTPTLTQSGNKYRAVFTNTCNSAMTTAATLTVFDQCMKDNSTGDLFQINSATGHYLFTVCSTGFTLIGTGMIGHQSGILTLTDSESNRKVSAGFNPASRTGSATIYLMVSTGVWQVFHLNATNPNANCKC